MTTYTNPFTGQTIQPSQVGYESLSFSSNTALQWPVNGNTSATTANIIDAIATVASLSLALPAAVEVSTGQSILITNKGSNAFTVTDYGGNTIVSVASGVSQYIYLTDNTTTNGSWDVVQFGATTSIANAASLQGYGVKAIGSTLNQSYPVSTISSSQSLVDSQRASFIVWNGGVGTLTLPSASAVGNDWFVNVRNGGTGILTIALAGSDTIDGNASTQLQLTESFVICSNGSTGYNTFGYGQAVQFSFTQLAKTVSSGTYTLNNIEASNIIQEYNSGGVPLVGNVTIVLPSTVQMYSIYNQTTGGYTLTFKTSAVGAQTISVPQNTTALIICDGTNVYSATTASSALVSSLTLNDGSASTPTLNFASGTTTGLYLPSSTSLGFSIVGVNKMTLDQTNGLTVVNGISGGTF